MPFAFSADRNALGGKERQLLATLQREYTEDLVRTVLVPFVTQTSLVSLRVLDWAVVNWSKQYNIVCSSLTPGVMTNVHHAYRSYLQHWKRRLFDPFRRRHRIEFAVDGARYATTLGQANFALWAYKTGVLRYVMSHRDAIQDNMDAVTRRQRRIKSQHRERGTASKRTELTHSGNNTCVAYYAPIRIRFDS